MTLCFFLSFRPALSQLALPCLRVSINPSPSGSVDVRVVAMMAWRVPLPACLPVVDLPIPLRPCRLVGRGGERVVFALGSVMAICPRARLVVPSLGGVAHILGVLLR